MRYELETIPIWDSYETDCECTLCRLHAKAETGYLDFFLGNSVMVPEMRVEVNRTGFCPEHYTRLMDTRTNRHGLGLVTHTRLVERASQMRSREQDIAGKTPKGGDKRKKMLVEYSLWLKESNRCCMICDRVASTLARYAYTIVYLWKKDDQGFRGVFSGSKGLCAVHLPLVIDMACEELGSRDLKDFSDALFELQQKNFARLDGEIFWYTQKFDFQNQDKPWGSSRDALHRSIQKMSGIIQKND